MDRPGGTRGTENEGVQDAAFMNRSGTGKEPIPADWAFRLCEMICQENTGRRFSLAKLFCLRCRNNPTRMGFARRPDNRACSLVNAREAHYRRAFQRS